MRDTHAAIRDAALDLMLNIGGPRPSLDDIAERASVPRADIEALAPTEEAFYSFLLRPFVEAVDAELKQLPLHQHPTLGQQREILDCLISASASHPRLIALALCLLADKQNRPHSLKSDQFAYQAGLRLMGSASDLDPDQLARVYFVSELIAVAVISRRHDLADARTRSILLDSLIGVLHPPTASPNHTNDRPRRWTDPV